MIGEYEILTLNEWTGNGHIYSTEEMNRTIAKFKDRKKPLLCTIDSDIDKNGFFDKVQLDKVSHEVTDLRIEGNKMYATIRVLNTPHGMVMQQLLDIEDHEYVFRPNGTGYVVCDGVIEDYELEGIALMHKDVAA